nr:MAG TPA: hypothetical protein [Bacteriophage sp.]
MDARQEILDAIDIIVDKKLKNTAQMYTGIVESANGTSCTMRVNGNTQNIRVFGNTPKVNVAYPVFVPHGDMSLAFTISV